MKQENQTIQEAVKCLQAGGKAWDKNKVEQRINPGGKYIFIPVASIIESLWTIEYPEDPQAVKTIDVVPKLFHGNWRLDFYLDKLQSMYLSDAVNHKDFVGYVWDDRDGNEFIDYECIKDKNKFGDLFSRPYKDTTKEICKAVRFIDRSE